jgi:hypothetical protein
MPEGNSERLMCRIIGSFRHSDLQPPANALPVFVVIPVELRTHYALLRNDLKARYKEHECDRTKKYPWDRQPDSPTHEYSG